MSDKDDTSSSPFEHHAAFDGGTAYSAPAQGISDSPPPVYYASPRDTESPPEPATTVRPWFPWSLAVAMVAAAVIVVALVVDTIFVVTNRERSSAPPDAVTSEDTVTSTLATPADAPPSPTYPTYDPESSGLRQLQQIADTDQPVVLNGATKPDKWVPQLGSKKLGSADGESSYDYPRIVKDFYQIKQSYPSAKLLRSGDWSTFTESDYWVTIAGVVSATSDGALNWCRSNGLDNNHCYAKLISTTQGVEGSTAFQ